MNILRRIRMIVFIGIRRAFCRGLLPLIRYGPGGDFVTDWHGEEGKAI